MDRPLDEAGARALAEEYLSAVKLRDDQAVIVSVDREPWGWIVHWTGRRALDGDWRSAYAGTGPILIDASGRMARAGSAHATDFYVDEWLAGRLPTLRPLTPLPPVQEPWFDVRLLEQSQIAFLAELTLELAPTHDLHGREAVALAKCGHCSEVLFGLDDGSFALVHLTWKRSQETPPWPRFTIAESTTKLSSLMDAHAD